MCAYKFSQIELSRRDKSHSYDVVLAVVVKKQGVKLGNEGVASFKQIILPSLGRKSCQDSFIFYCHADHIIVYVIQNAIF